jgi:transcriptional regulator with XRE-family HTH domain
MRTRKKSKAVQLLEDMTGGPLTLGGLLEAIRQGEEISQVAFARSLGISRAQLCDIEKGRRHVSPGRAAAFARLLGYSETQFVRLALQQLVTEAGLKVKVSVEAA